jgi:hypothetical protein
VGISAALFYTGVIMEKSCWGCGNDYKEFSDEDDLSELFIYGEKELVCWACFDELPEDYDQTNLNKM